MTPNTGTYVSGIGHGILILWALIGGFFLRANDPLPLQSTEVSLMSSEEFAALSLPDASPDVPTEALEVVAPEPEEAAPEIAPTVEAAPEVLEPAPALEPEPEPEPAPAIDVPDDAPILPDPPSEQASTAEPTIPEAEAQPEQAPRVAPIPAPAPEPDAEISETVTPEVVPDAEPEPEVEVVVEEAPATAPQEATTEIVTEAEKPSAPTESVRPKSRPKPQTRVAETPPPETPIVPADAVADAVASALAETTFAAAPAPAPAAPTGPPLTGGEKDALRVAVQQCWNVGSLSTDALQTTVVVSVNMSRDARPETGSIRMLSFEGGSEASAGQAYEAARRAIIRCGANGYDLPAEKFAQWQTIEMTFNPEKMRIK